MNSQNNKGTNDQSLDNDLKQLDHLYRSEEREVPPDLLDQAILNKAKRAVEPTNGWLDFGWVHGVTTVALVVLTFSIITFQRGTGELGPGSNAPLNAPASPPAASQSGASVEVSAKRTSNKTSDESMSDQPSIMLDDLAEAASSNQPIESAKKEVQAQSRSRDQDTSQPQLKASPSLNSAADPAQETRMLTAPAIEAVGPSEPISTSADGKSAGPKYELSEEADLLGEKKQKLESASLDSMTDSTERELSSALSQQQLKLNEILALKNGGDESWKEALKEFKALYPDFTLPDELQDPDELKNKD